MKLIQYIAMTDAFIAICVLNSYFVCDLKLPQLFNFTVLFDDE